MFRSPTPAPSTRLAHGVAVQGDLALGLWTADRLGYYGVHHHFDLHLAAPLPVIMNTSGEFVAASRGNVFNREMLFCCITDLNHPVPMLFSLPW